MTTVFHQNQLLLLPAWILLMHQLVRKCVRIYCMKLNWEFFDNIRKIKYSSTNFGKISFEIMFDFFNNIGFDFLFILDYLIIIRKIFVKNKWYFLIILRKNILKKICLKKVGFFIINGPNV